MSDSWCPERAAALGPPGEAGTAHASEWWRSERARPLRPRGEPRTAFAAMLVLLFVLMLAPQQTFPALAVLRPALLAAIVAAGALFAERLSRGEKLARLTPELKIAGALAAWAVVGIPASVWPGGSISFLIEGYLKTLAIFFLISQTVTTLARLTVVCWALTLMAIPLALTGITNYLSGNFLAGSPVRRITGYNSGLASNPNDLALMLNLVLPIALGLLASSRSAAVRMALSGATGLLAVGVVLTFSRTGFLTLALVFLLCFVRLLRRGRGGAAVAVVGVAACAVALLPAAYSDRLATILDIESDPTGSAQSRWTDTGAAIRYMLANPLLGCGVGMNVLALNEARGPKWLAVHNAYLEHGVELGLPGLALYLALVGRCMATARGVRRHAESAGPKPLEPLAWGIQTALGAFALAALFHPVAYHFYFFLPAGLAVAAKNANPVPRDTSRDPLDRHRTFDQAGHVGQGW